MAAKKVRKQLQKEGGDSEEEDDYEDDQYEDDINNEEFHDDDDSEEQKIPQATHPRPTAVSGSLPSSQAQVRSTDEEEVELSAEMLSQMSSDELRLVLQDQRDRYDYHRSNYQALQEKELELQDEEKLLKKLHSEARKDLQQGSQENLYAMQVMKVKSVLKRILCRTIQLRAHSQRRGF